MKHSIVFALAPLVLVSACASDPFAAAPRKVKADGLTFLSTDSEREAALIQTQEGTEVCLGPFSDAVPAGSTNLSLTLGANLGGGTDSASEGSASGAEILGGRSPAVLITREILYRTCELTLNADLNKTEATALFETALDHIATIAASEASDQGTQAVQFQAPPLQE